jgi:hypothetical protein
MATPAEDANAYAFEGGDTEPETAKEIKARNDAVQQLHEQQIEHAKQREEQRQEALDHAAKAEEAVFADTPELIGAASVEARKAVSEGSSESSAKPKASSKKQSSSSEE